MRATCTLLSFLVLATLTTGACTAHGEPAMSAKITPTKTGHVAANGVSYYYEIHGEGPGAGTRTLK